MMNVILTINKKIDPHILYWSILEIFQELGIVVNSNKNYYVSNLHNKIKEVKDELWSKIRWCVNLLGLTGKRSLILVKVSSVQLSEVKVIISLRYENE